MISKMAVGIARYAAAGCFALLIAGACGGQTDAPGGSSETNFQRCATNDDCPVGQHCEAELCRSSTTDGLSSDGCVLPNCNVAGADVRDGGTLHEIRDSGIVPNVPDGGNPMEIHDSGIVPNVPDGGSPLCSSAEYPDGETCAACLSRCCPTSQCFGDATCMTHWECMATCESGVPCENGCSSSGAEACDAGNDVVCYFLDCHNWMCDHACGVWPGYFPPMDGGS